MSGLASIDFGIVGPAFAAGLLVLATHVPLGLRVLRRGIVFIDLAIAQVVSAPSPRACGRARATLC
jgi:zinc/manganese transport system permease protein